MLKKVSGFFEIILHPLLFVTYGLIIILSSGGYIAFLPVEIKKILVIIFFTGTVLLPISIVSLLSLRNFFSQIAQNNAQMQSMKLLLFLVFYYLTYFVLTKLPLPSLIINYMALASISLGVATIISYKWNISIPMYAFGFLIAVIIKLSYSTMTNLIFLLMIIVLLSGISASIFIYLEKNKPSEIYSALGIGFLGVIILMILF